MSARPSEHADSTLVPAISPCAQGHHPASPFQIPWAGWKQILWRTYARINEDRLLAIAAGVVFFGLLAIFPAITALVSFYGLFANPSTIAANLQSLALMLPEGSFQIVQDQIARVLAKGGTELGATFLFGLALAIWSANAGVKGAYRRAERRLWRAGKAQLPATKPAFTGIHRRRNRRFAADGSCGGGLSPDARSFGPRAGEQVDIQPGALAAAFPDSVGGARPPLPVRAEPGAPPLGVAECGHAGRAFLWIVGSSLLSWYLSNFANYNATYGSLGAAIGLMMWMWMSAIIVLWGAELNSEIERQMAMDTTATGPRPLGACDAAMADTLCPAVAGVPKEH
jgi:membrane protein